MSKRFQAGPKTKIPVDPSDSAQSCRTANSNDLSVAIVGAGISGLVAGRTLHAHGLEVAVFDKGRGPGGRTSTRRHLDYSFDHGAQYFTVRDPRFRHSVDSWIEDGVVTPWAGRMAVARGGEVTVKAHEIDRYVGVPGMSSLARHLASDLGVTYGARVEVIEGQAGHWHLTTDGGTDLGSFGTVLVTAPPAQATQLLTAAPELARQVGAVELRPCWAVMAVFDQRLDLSFDGAFVEDSPLSWVARNNSKPGRPSHESWVLHGSPAWSARHLEDPAEAVGAALLTAFFQAVGHEPQTPHFARVHRWRYSIAADPLQVGCLWDPALRLGVCGDWCSGSRVEGAFLSGLAAAGRVLGPSTSLGEDSPLTTGSPQ